MVLDGYLDAVEHFQARGWVYEPANPQRILTVEILLHGRKVGSVAAGLYRTDLEQAGIGAGNHAFVFNFDQKLNQADIAHVSARVAKDDGSFAALNYIAAAEAPAVSPMSLLRFEGLTSDTTQSPVFVLGAARSGTSAVAQALLKLGRFKGHQEGHLLDMLAHLSVALDKFYDEKGDELAPGRDTMVSSVPWNYFQSSLDAMFIETVRTLFPDGSWVDKTPNSNMIHLAPRFLRIWPHSRFIFMKRRFLENAASRATKFPGVGFRRNCREWSESMAAWLSVRDQLHGAAIELDQKFLKEQPDVAAESISRLLQLTGNEKERLGQAFKYDYPERTSPNQPVAVDITSMGWQPEQIQDYEHFCAPVMEPYGYSTDVDYYLPGRESNGLIWI
jgi:hypothetical protein